MIDISVITVVPEAFILEVIAPERIIVINLDRRPDRWTALQSAWHSSIAERLTRFSATDGLLLPPHRVEECRSRKDQPFEQSAGILGCRDSWMRAVENYGPGLYFEDDARPCQSWPYGLPPEDAEFVLLGGDLWPKSPAPGWSPVRQQIAGAQAVWIRTQRAADSLLKTWRSEADCSQAVDVAWNRPLKRAGAVVAVPQIVYQVDLGTDVQVGRTYQAGETNSYDPWCSLDGQALKRMPVSPVIRAGSRHRVPQ